MTKRVITHRVESIPVVELPEALAGLRDQYGTLGLIGFLARFEAADAARHRARLEPTPAADAAQLAAALQAFVAQAVSRAEAQATANRVGVRTPLAWVRE
jgi:hypothetical protein